MRELGTTMLPHSCASAVHTAMLQTMRTATRALTCKQALLSLWHGLKLQPACLIRATKREALPLLGPSVSRLLRFLAQAQRPRRLQPNLRTPGPERSTPPACKVSWQNLGNSRKSSFQVRRDSVDPSLE